VEAGCTPEKYCWRERKTHKKATQTLEGDGESSKKKNYRGGKLKERVGVVVWGWFGVPKSSIVFRWGSFRGEKERGEGGSGPVGVGFEPGGGHEGRRRSFSGGEEGGQ